MLAGGLDILYREALAGSHRIIVRAEVWRDGARIDEFGDEGLPILGGNVSATLRSRVTRSVNMTVDETLVPALDDEDGLLTPYGNYLKIFRGIELGNGLPYEWPIFYGMIGETNDPGDGTIEIEGDDRAGEVDRAKFSSPRTSSVGASVRAQVMELIEEAVPDAQFDVALTGFADRVPLLTWEFDRSRALDELATSSGAFWWALPNGTFTLRPVPWANFAPPALRLDEIVDPANPGGAIVHKARGRVSNESVINEVVAYGERMDGSTPVWATARDLNPASPTRADGPVGRRTRLLRLQTPQNTGSIAGAAQDYLRRASGIVEEWSWEQTIDPAMELGEVVLLAPKRRRTAIVQVVSGFNISLGMEGTMGVTARAMTIGLGDDDA
jgi:hypothetical protein